jgi:hypothetical protein
MDWRHLHELLGTALPRDVTFAVAEAGRVFSSGARPANSR